MKKIFILSAVFVLAVILTGCSSKTDDFVDFDKAGISMPDEPEAAKAVEATTEFPEYDGDVDEIVLLIANNSDEDFEFGEYYILQKLDEGEWKYINVFGVFLPLGISYPPSHSSHRTIKLTEHIKQPLLPGRYRIGIGNIDVGLGIHGTVAFAEFTIK